MAGMGRGRGATTPAWMAQGAPGAPSPDGQVVPPDVEEAARAAVLREQELSMQQTIAQQSGQKRSYDELQAGGQAAESPAEMKARPQCALRSDRGADGASGKINRGSDHGTGGKTGTCQSTARAPMR